MISPWSTYVETQNATFSAEFESSEVDALLCEWAPTEELFSFPGRKAWYCCEPEHQFASIENGQWVKCRSLLKESEFLFHRHEKLEYRVPHITHFQELETSRNQNRLERAVAIISNFGGGARSRHSEASYRNRFATCDLVDLFGRVSWHQYKKSIFSLPKAPGNYRGEIAGDWHAAEKRALLSTYKVCVCIESMTEPFYFTEKLVEAVSAGCIPVYRAHASLRDTVLKGAKWVDPADYGGDPKRTIESALGMDLEEFRRANSQWLLSALLGESHQSRVFNRIGLILSGRQK